MGQLSPILRSVEGGGLAFRCPGCDETHMVGPGWTYNGNPDAPTFTPSVLVKSGHFIEGRAGKDCWCTFEERIGRKPQFSCKVCHSFVTDGQIQFLGDCTHALAGQTVALPEWDD